jgi:hypothetical protein
MEFLNVCYSVVAMREFVGLGSDQSKSISSGEIRKPNRYSRVKSVSASANIQIMRDAADLHESETSTEHLGSEDDSELFARRAKHRPNRRKTASASSEIKLMRNASNKIDDFNSLNASMTSMSLAEGEEMSFDTITARPNANIKEKLPDITSVDTTCQKSEISGIPLSFENEVLKNVDDNTIPSKFDKGYGSDEDDVPEVKTPETHRTYLQLPHKSSFTEKFRAYFRSSIYFSISFLFGTMLCLLCVGMRLEAVMIDTGVLPNSQNTWHLRPNVSFWLEASLLICFILGGIVMTILFRAGKRLDHQDHCLFVAAGIDIMISIICFICLMVSQFQRCCGDSEKRLLGTDYHEGEVDKGTVYVECCPPFGERLYGGIGLLELFTSLIALRVVRFWVAKIIVKKLYSFEGDEAEHNAGSMSGSHSHHHGNHGEEIGTAVDLWNSALEAHPNIVQQYGEFSSQLLQVMLGIPALETNVSDSDTSKNLIPKDLSSFKKSKEPINSTLPSDRSLHQGTLISAVSENVHSALSAGTQAIILAGKVGKAIRALPYKDGLRLSQQSTGQRSSTLNNSYLQMQPLFEVCDVVIVKLCHFLTVGYQWMWLLQIMKLYILRHRILKSW